jgi:hypothetical protein
MTLLPDLKEGAPKCMKASYLTPLPLYDSVKPYNLQIELPPGVPRSNIQVTVHEGIPVRDCRGHEHEFSLESVGFQFVRFPTNERLEMPNGLECYLREAEGFLKELLEADEVRVFEYKVNVNWYTGN